MATWLITGAARGLGAEIARAALARGNDVVAAARDPRKLPADLRDSEQVLGVQLDVTRSADVPAAIDAAIDRFGGIDVLVNNAGRGLLGALEELSDQEVRSLFELNVFGLLNTTRAALPALRESGGRIVHIGSRGGFEGEPGAGAYNATKFAVAGISEALAAELAPLGVQSMVVEPGTFRTDFLDGSSLSRPANPLAVYDGTPAHDTLDWAAATNHAQLGDPALAARFICEVTEQEKLPGHLPVGADAIERLEVKLAALRGDLDQWREAAAATAAE